MRRSNWYAEEPFEEGIAMKKWSVPSGGRGQMLAPALALGLMAALPYLRGIDNAFIEFDDPEYVTTNIHVLKGLTWEGISWAMTTFSLGNWHPLTWLSHMTVVSLFGIEPRWHHAANILLHALNTGLLFLALARLTGAPWRSAFVAALFGVHPLHVESVAWVAERKDLLAGLFFMLVLLAYERYARRGKKVHLLAVTLFLALGLTAKPMLVTVPFLLLLLDLWPLGRAPWLLLEKAPLFALSLASCVVTFLAQGKAIAALESLPLGARLANAVVSYAAYLGKTVWPASLTILYPYRPHSPWAVLGAALLLAALSWVMLSRFRRAPFLTIGWFWFGGMLVPVIGIVQVGDQALADRYTYLPLIGIFAALAWGVPRVVPERWQRAPALAVAAGAALVLLTWTSWVQVGLWKDSPTIFRHTLALTSGNWLIENNLGSTLYREGKFDEAEIHLREAIRIMPNDPEAHNNLGNALYSQRNLDGAIVEYRAAISLRPDLPEAHNNLGNAMLNKGELDAAIIEYRETIRLAPDNPKAYSNLGSALFGTGKLDEAIAQYREAIRLLPDFANARYNLGNALEARGLLDEAVVQYQNALRIRPDLVMAHERLAAVLERLGRHAEARRHGEAAGRWRGSGSPP